MYLYDAPRLISSLKISYQNFYNNIPLNEIAQQNNARLQLAHKPRTQITTKPFHCGKRVLNFNLEPTFENSCRKDRLRIFQLRTSAAWGVHLQLGT